MKLPPTAPSLPASLADAKQIHEVLVEAFGHYIMWSRNQSLAHLKELVEVPELREKLGNIFRRKYEEAASLDSQAKAVCYGLVESGMEFFAKLVLATLSDRGDSHRLESGQIVRFRLDAEVIDPQNGNVLLVETINRGGSKHFADYWGRWLNRFG